ncbi:hypothetical protein [[Mycoplasma] testudinis]|uniref:hypothetical protein n=1 Tax=[Mycoplasma] testudinis TaxID=33924 RepID=UPI0004879BAE|nr:hypothetical protein [[Mycoplasma] testudinis]
MDNPDIFDQRSASNLIKSMTEVFSEPLNAILKTKMKEHLGRDEHERSKDANYRNGFTKK